MPSKFWKCRQCEAYNRKSVGACEWCGCAFQIMHTEPSTKENPAHSHEQVAPNGYGHGKGYGGKGYGSGWYQPGQYWPAPAGPYMYAYPHGGKGPQSGGKGKGKGKADAQLGSPAKAGTGEPTSLSEGESLYASSSRSGAGYSNAWQKRRMNRRVVRSSDGAKEESPAHASSEDAANQSQVSDQAKSLSDKMETVQALITSLKGRTDDYSSQARAQLEQDLNRLRILKTQLKPLTDQSSILEALVEKRSSQLTQAEQDVQTAISTMEEAKQSLMVAKEQLAQVHAAKAREDQLIQAQKADMQLPDNQKSVEKMKDLVCLLPVEHAGAFGECLNLLSGLLQQAATPFIQVVPDSDSEMGQTESSLIGNTDSPLIPSLPSAVVVTSDPYSAELNAAPFTPRRRTRSDSPKRSPGSGARSRSTSNRRLTFKQSGNMTTVLDAFSRREGNPIPFP